MKNFIQAGKTVTLAAPYDRNAGEGALVGALFGVAVNDVLSGVDGEFMTEGVFDIKKTSALAISQGDQLYWDDTAKELNKTSSNTPVGVALADAANPSATVRVKLEPQFAASLSSSITGTHVEDTANANVIGGVPVVHRILVASGADGDVDVVLTHKTRVIEAWAVLKGAGTTGSLITVKSGANAISDAIDVASGGDRDVFRAGEINDANHEIAAAGTLRVSKASTGGDFPGAEVYVMGLRIA